jgi:hypothetical protein
LPLGPLGAWQSDPKQLRLLVVDVVEHGLLLQRVKKVVAQEDVPRLEDVVALGRKLLSEMCRTREEFGTDPGQARPQLRVVRP